MHRYLVTAVEYPKHEWDEFGSAMVKTMLECGHKRRFNLHRKTVADPQLIVRNSDYAFDCRVCLNEDWIQANKEKV